MAGDRRAPSPYPRVERAWSAIAHGNALAIGLPLAMLGFLPFSLSLAICPVVAYLIARTFRRRDMAWGAFQGMQAATLQLVLFVLAFTASQFDVASRLAATLWTVWFLLFLYSLWGALDTWLGYNFRYIIIGRFLDHVSRSNLARKERRRQWFNTLEDQERRSRR